MLADFISHIRFNGENVQTMVIRMAVHTYRNPDGGLYVRYLNWNGTTWNWNYIYLDNDWNANNPALVLAS